MIKKLFVLQVFILRLRQLSISCHEDIHDLFQFGSDDVQKLVSTYFNPSFKGLEVALNVGWTNAAKEK